MHAGVRAARRTARGFTLLELVLAIVLFMLLTGSIVFSFTSLQKGAQLDEGIGRLLTVVRYAKAHAATSGRPLQFQLIQAADAAVGDTGIRIHWEPDPADKPGEYADLAETRPMVDAVNDLVQCRLPDKPDPNSAALESGDNTILKRLVLYPDGSADATRLIVTSRDGEDIRRFLFEIVGITGELRKRELNTNEFSETMELPRP
jgi:type II secretory pathway pseudopilin PulG